MHERVIRDNFKSLFRTEAGDKFWGELSDPNAFPRPRKELQNLPHRALVTDRNAVATAGQLVVSKAVSYILCGQHTLSKTRVFLAVEVTVPVTWSRHSEVTDPVTKMVRDSSLQPLATILVAVEPYRVTEDEAFEQNVYRYFTHAAVQLGDVLGSKKVVRVADLMGLRIVEVS